MLPEIKRVAERKKRPIKVLQFGEGNFLRAFVDYMIDVANEAGVFCGNVAVVKPIPHGSLELFEKQDNFFTVCLRGRQDGNTVDQRRLITCVEQVADPYAAYQDYLELAKLPELEFVLSNTTEAGIVFSQEDRLEDAPPASFPAKLTQFLHHRFRHFDGEPSKGLTLLPVELIENNGGKLKECVERYIQLWQLEAAFAAWVEEHCTFCSTLVDRIVTGYPREEAPEICRQLGYEDSLLAAAEPFGLWVIESGRDISSRFPLDKAGMPVVFTDNQRPYRERKVRILNGAHTGTVLGAFLAGKDTVGECMADPLIRRFLETALQQDILPTVPLPEKEVQAFAEAVVERFENPFVRHEILSIALNSVSKWKSRILPSLKDRLQQTGALPLCLTFSFAALAAFYSGGKLVDGVWTGMRDATPYPIQDDAPVLTFFAENSGLEAGDLVRLLASKAEFWGEDLSALPGFADTAGKYLEVIRTLGAAAAMEQMLCSYHSAGR